MTARENNYFNGNLKEVDFKTTYIATFLASYMAGRYERDCSNGHRGDPAENQPIEDANYLANEAWKSIVDTLGPK